MAAFFKAFGIVPAWAWALAVCVLVAACIRLDVQRLQAEAEAGKAKADLLAVQLASERSMSIERERARKEERRLSLAAVEAQNELSQAMAGHAGRVADLHERLRHAARSMSCRPSAGAAPAAAGVGDGQPSAGLPGVDGAHLVIVDEQGLADLADFAASAQVTGDTLTAARRLLRACWAGR